ncbi:hypothetical protein [Blastococcus sp. VKM Ac-2987]|uniref:hypothetical protein n=1 Tax=Blastococcus sp. VKM Ac-2987 TaxID=3004141 RepID=UPI0022AB837A|nr:hypothetical protein [Blastococcus sp. VKM Ac-2987]MCZ2858664.1 hypothetical protein [Blastococcus sp. VKM Ac-2987]
MWTEHGPDDLHRRMVAPTNEIPVALPVNAVLARTDDAGIRRAAEQIVPLWPWSPPTPREDRDRRGPDLPGDSWFAG